MRLFGRGPNDVLRTWSDCGPGVPRLGSQFPCDVIRTAVGMRKCCATAAIQENPFYYIAKLPSALTD
jgi:hypothetical protein